MTTDQRKKTLLKRYELELAIEGRFTNLRIWLSKDEKIRFRLDKANSYSAPLKDETVRYLNKHNPIITTLNERFGFDGATINDIDTIVELTKEMKLRPCIQW